MAKDCSQLTPTLDLEVIRPIVEASPNATLALDGEGRILLVNRATEHLFGYDRIELINRSIETLIPNVLGECIAGATSPGAIALTSLATSVGREFRATFRDKADVPVELSFSPIPTNTGSIALCTVVDVSGRKRSERVLLAIQEVQTQFIADAPAHQVFDGLLSSLLSFSESEYGFIGQILHDDSGQPFLKTHALTNVAWNEETRKFYEENAPDGLEFSNMETLFGSVITSGQPVISNEPENDPRSAGRPPGHPPLDAFMGIPLYCQDELVGMAGIANRRQGYDEQLLHEMQPLTTVCAALVRAYRTEQSRKRAEENVQSSEKRFRALIEHSYDAVCLFSAKGELQYASPSVENVLGYMPDELSSSRLADAQEVDGKSSREASFLNTFRGTLPPAGDTSQFVHRVRHKNKTERIIEVSVTNLLYETSVSAVVWNFRDVTDRETAARLLREKESQLAHVSRLHTMGEMIAAIAHEINQPLAAIANFAAACRRTLDRGQSEFGRIRDWTEQIGEQAMKSGEIIKRLRGFTTPRTRDREEVDLNEIVRESLALIDADAHFRSVAVATELTEPSATVLADSIQLQQVILNLLRNSCDAAGQQERSTGKVHVRTHVSSNLAVVEVQDNGPGIAADLIEDIFDPFFTTKSSGMGLGLAVSKSIVESHRGKIWADPKIAAGAKLVVSLPLAQAIDGNQTPIVFLVDDNTEFSASTEALLVTHGFQVQPHRSAEAFLQSFDPDRVGCLVVDIRLGGMSGLELQQELITRRCRIPIILISGHADQETIDLALRNGAADVLHKPFTGEEFCEKIRRALSGGRLESSRVVRE